MPALGRADLDSPQVRVCVGCGERWHSVNHYSDEASWCEQCGLPLVETFATAVAKVSRSSGAFRVRRFG